MVGEIRSSKHLRGPHLRCAFVLTIHNICTRYEQLNDELLTEPVVGQQTTERIKVLSAALLRVTILHRTIIMAKNAVSSTRSKRFRTPLVPDPLRDDDQQVPLSDWHDDLKYYSMLLLLTSYLDDDCDAPVYSQ